MEKYQPNELGAELLKDPTITLKQARRNIERRLNRAALKTLDRDLRHGVDISEGFTDAEAERELRNSGVFPHGDLGAHVIFELPTIHPQEVIEHDYNGDSPQNPEYWDGNL